MTSQYTAVPTALRNRAYVGEVFRRARKQTAGDAKVRELSRLAPPAGLEPATRCLEGSRSIR